MDSGESEVPLLDFAYDAYSTTCVTNRRYYFPECDNYKKGCFVFFIFWRAYFLCNVPQITLLQLAYTISDSYFFYSPWLATQLYVYNNSCKWFRVNPKAYYMILLSKQCRLNCA